MGKKKNPEIVDSVEDLEGEFSYAGRRIVPPPWDGEGDLQVTTGGGAVLRNPSAHKTATKGNKQIMSYRGSGGRTRYALYKWAKFSKPIEGMGGKKIGGVWEQIGKRASKKAAMKWLDSEKNPLDPFFNQDTSGGLYSEGLPARMGGKHLFDQRMPLALDTLSNPRNPSDSISRYISRIRNAEKKRYAQAYAKWLAGGEVGPEPNRGKLSVMGAQSVWMELRKLMRKGNPDRGADTRDSINRGECPSCGQGIAIPADVKGGECPACGEYVEVAD